jgi:hypothetical protein
MSRRIVTPLLLLAAALALPAAASASVHRIGAPPASDGGQLSGKQALHRAEALLDGRGHPERLELSPLLKQVAVSLPHMSDRDQVRARKLLARPTDDAAFDEDAYSVQEEHPYCPTDGHFCIHWVSTTGDAPPPADDNSDGIPNYVVETYNTFSHVYDVENGGLHWRLPKPDGTRGCEDALPGTQCTNKTDVYLKQIGDQELYGYSATDAGESGHIRSAYLVVDNDFADPIFSDYANPLDPLEVTAAHEYNHVLQYAYDVYVNTWMFEASATWAEDVVYTAVNDYLQYIPGWAQLSVLPLTNELGSNDEYTSKTYGDMVWNVYLQSRFGVDTIRKTWEHAYDKRPVRSYAPGAYDGALADKGSNFYDAFTSFAGDTAEWRAANSPFKEGASFDDVQRELGSGGKPLTIGVNGDTISVAKLPHAAYMLVNVGRTSKKRIKLIVTAERGVQMAAALVGRTGTQTGGQMRVVLKRLPRGGSATATMLDPAQYSRLTLALVNGDVRTTGHRYLSGEWQYLHKDAGIEARVSSDFTPPRITHRSPGAGRHGVSRRTAVRVRFSERMTNVRSGTVVLRGPGGNRVKAKLKLSGGGRKLLIRPRAKLRAHKRYTVRIGSSVRDRGANALSAASRTWKFTTRR